MPLNSARSGVSTDAVPIEADPVTTEIIRHALNSAANQMKSVLIRTAFSPVIYEVLDFAVAVFDVSGRLLAQAPSLPIFMGTLSFCVTESVKAIGGEANLYPGDALIYNWPYATGGHQNDITIVMPIYLDGSQLIGYAAAKGHCVDVGGKDPDATDTVDVFQEGIVYPAVKIYRRGELNDDVYRIFLANSRVPHLVAGDLNALIGACRTGSSCVQDVIRRVGKAVFDVSVEHMFDHGDKIIRKYIESIPDGRYVGHGEMDSDGISDDRIPFEISVEIEGSDIRIDFSGCPDTQVGPVNCPLPATVAASRVAISMLAGHGEAPHEGHSRVVQVITRPGSMFHPLPPAPCIAYGFAAIQTIDVIYDAIAKAMPSAVPAPNGGDICSLILWGRRVSSGEGWVEGTSHPIGQGGSITGDGGTVQHIAQSATRLPPIEVSEAKRPWIIDRLALAQDSCGAGTFRGGLGIDLHFRVTEDLYITTSLDRTKNGPMGLAGGTQARPNAVGIRFPDGRFISMPRRTRFLVPKGSVIELSTGGGAGYGPPANRSVEAVKKDLEAGYISHEFAQRHYPHAFH